jgi:hypothetical protein
VKTYCYVAVLCCLFVLFLLLPGFSVGQNTKPSVKDEDDVCSASNPASVCAAANTCPSPCSIDIRRSGSSYATAKPSIPDAKSNKPFCIKVGTTVNFTSSSSRTGFVVDFGETDPFEQVGTIMGGADKPVTVIAKRPGCYTYTIGACTAGTVYGMCGNAVAQLIISAE